MPEVSFIGEVDYVSSLDYEVISVTWAIVCGSSSWSLKSGLNHGETHNSTTADELGKASFNHPIDVLYHTSTAEGWPFIVCEVWDKSNDGHRSFIGCGCTWLPPSSGAHYIDINLWKPCNLGITNLLDNLVPSCPDLKALREIIVSPYMRSQVQSDSVGCARFNINTITSGFDDFGVQL